MSSDNEQIQALKREIDRLQGQLDATRAKRIRHEIDAHLHGLPFQDEKARQMFRASIEQSTVVGPTGGLTAKGLPLGTYIDMERTALPSLFATASSPTTKPRQPAEEHTYDMDSIRPGMPKAEIENALRAIRQATQRTKP